MTAVALQQRNPPRQQYNPRQPSQSSNRSQPQTPQGQSYTQSHHNIPSSSTSASGSNGAVSTASSGSANYNEQPRRTGGPNGASTNMMPHPTTNGESSRANGNGARRLSDIEIQTHHRRNQSSSALARPNGARENSEPGQDVGRRRPKPLLKRSKSDYGPRAGEELEDNQDNDAPDWGARHGFEGHYASEEYVSQLANVSRACLFCFIRYHGWVRYGFANNTGSPNICHRVSRIKRCTPWSILG